eukprot:gb/GECH01005327.1/.p1 GENE.gb/GECH01005327.1/~~gb/GECH01005327.1/.p1  ORF type:complete len:445 (+),score=98.39 gb/GECH01005327.1/:1-1335(+)
MEYSSNSSYYNNELVHEEQQQHQHHQQQPTSNIHTYPSSSITCVVCSKDLTHLSTPRRNAHVERCIAAKEPQQSAPDYACVVCGKDLSSASHRYRVDHLKACARQHDVAPSDIRHTIPDSLRFSGKGHTAVRSFLKRHHLTEYSDTLLSAGFDTLDRITSLARTDDVRTSILGIPPSPARRLSRAAEELLHIRQQEKERARRRRVKKKKQKRRLKRVPKSEKHRVEQAMEASLQPTEFHAPPLLITSRRQSLDEIASAAISKMFRPHQDLTIGSAAPRRTVREDGLWEASSLGSGLEKAQISQLAMNEGSEDDVQVLTATDLQENQREEIWMPEYSKLCRESISKAETGIQTILNHLQEELHTLKEQFAVSSSQVIDLPPYLQQVQSQLRQSQDEQHSDTNPSDAPTSKPSISNVDNPHSEFVVDISELEMLSPVSQESDNGDM